MRKTFRYILTLQAWMWLLPLHAQQFTLDQCIESALQCNVDLKNARLDLAMADEQRASALTNYFPQVSATAVGFVGAKDLMRSSMDIPATDLTPLLGMPVMLPPMSYPISMVKKGAVATLTALQPLYTGGQIVTGNKLAEVQQEVRRLQLEMTEKDVRQNVHNYYWQLAQLRGNITTLDAVDKQLDEVHRLTENYVQAGVINRNDLLRVELKQQEMQSQRLSLTGGIELVRMLLAQLVGADLHTFDIVPDTSILQPQKPDTYFVSPDQAVSRREEVALAAQSVRANELQVKMTRGKNLPTVAVGATGMYMNVMEQNQGNLIGMATVSVPISSWWGGSHDIKKARLAAQQSLGTMADVQQKLHIDILNAWNQLNEAYAQIEIARKSTQQADENLRLNRDQYRVGAIGMTDLLDAVTLYTQSHNNLVSACANYQSKLADYQRKTR